MTEEYPLEQLKTIKKKRLDQAIINVEKKLALLKIEEEKLQKAEEEKNKVLKHKGDKLQQLRESMDKGTTSDKIQQKKNYLKVVEEKLQEKERAVQNQKKEVERALKNLEEAKKELIQKRKDFEKLEIHEKIWTKELIKEALKAEALIEDELGSIRHVMKNREEKKRKAI